MLLSALPAVLLQTVMHPLAAKEIVALARTCKYALRCASSVFAWKHCAARHVNVNDDHPAPALLAGLGRFQPVFLLWGSLWSLSASQIANVLALASAQPIVKMSNRTDCCR